MRSEQPTIVRLRNSARRYAFTGCVGLLSLVGSLAGCSGGSSVTNPATPAPTPSSGPIRTVVAQGGFTLSAPESDGTTFFVTRSLSTSMVGTLEVVVDWTFATNTLWMYITEGDCTGEQFENVDCPGPTCACRFSVVSEVGTPKPRVLTVPSATAGTRTLIVWNLGPREDSGSYQVVLTSAGAASASTPRRAGADEVRAKRRPGWRQ